MTIRRIVLGARVASSAIDGWLADHAIVIDGDAIVTVLPRGQLAGDYASTHEVHDLGDVSILPGFIETHVHMHYPSPLDWREIARPEPHEALMARAAANMRALLLSGATTARDTGSRDEIALAVRSAIREGTMVGPRLLISGAPITTTGGHYWFLGCEADTTDEVVRAVRTRGRAGVDAIKIMVSGGGYTPGSNPRSEQYALATVRAAVDEAHRLGLPVLAHSLTAAGNQTCVDAGVDTIIHGGVWWTDYTVRDRAYAYDPAVADRMAAAGTWVDPTIGEVQLHDERVAAGLPMGPEFEHWALPDVPSELAPRLEFMRDMLARGVRFIGGMGMGMPIVGFDSVACSAQVYGRLLGLGAWQAIATITTEAAAALGLGATVGAIRPGMRADLVAVAGDPAEDLALLRQVHTVIHDGRVVVRAGEPLVQGVPGVG